MMITPQRCKQQLLFSERVDSLGRHGTFFPNYGVAVHRWYPFIEGFSSEFVQRLIEEFGHPSCRVYDPFAGTGTTVTVAAANRMCPYYSEINPFMRLVVECKTNALRQVARQRSPFADYLAQIQERAAHMCSEVDASHDLQLAFGDRPYFRGKRLVEIISLKRAILEHEPPTPEFHQLAKLAIASIAVACSEMKRAADLRYRNENERLPEAFSPLEQFGNKADQIVTDINSQYSELPPVRCISESALTEPRKQNHIDLVITSPPYLNGTNYFRNTKIELWLTGLLRHESDLRDFRDAAMAAGINNISGRGRTPQTIRPVEAVASKLDAVAYDRRIPELVRRYFSDSLQWIGNVSKLLRVGGTAVIDIGDSRFAGVHVPTDEFLARLASIRGLRILESRDVRTRRSKDGEPLKQVLLILKKERMQDGKLRDQL